MPLNDRAAQFAPFAALNGFDEIIGEETRYTDPGKDLEEHEREVIDRKAAEGARYVGWFPAVQGPSGKTLEFDLIFEVNA